MAVKSMALLLKFLKDPQKEKVISNCLTNLLSIAFCESVVTKMS